MRGAGEVPPKGAPAALADASTGWADASTGGADESTESGSAQEAATLAERGAQGEATGQTSAAPVERRERVSAPAVVA